MPKCLITTFGWTEQFVLSSILRYGLNKGDEIVLLIPDLKDEKSEAIIKDFSSFLRKYSEGIELRVERIPIDNFSSAVTRIARVIKRVKSKGECIFNLSGGMRILILATYTAILLLCPRNVKIEVETEDRKKVFEIPNISVESLIKLSDIDRKIIKSISVKERTSSELIRELAIPTSTFHKHIKKLEKTGLLKITRKGRKLVIKSTDLGRILTLTDIEIE